MKEADAVVATMSLRTEIHHHQHHVAADRGIFHLITRTVEEVVEVHLHLL